MEYRHIWQFVGVICIVGLVIFLIGTAFRGVTGMSCAPVGLGLCLGALVGGAVGRIVGMGIGISIEMGLGERLGGFDRVLCRMFLGPSNGYHSRDGSWRFLRWYSRSKHCYDHWSPRRYDRGVRKNSRTKKMLGIGQVNRGNLRLTGEIFPQRFIFL